MSTGAGNNVSKANVVAVLEKSVGTNVSKANLYSVLEVQLGAHVSKANMYVVLEMAPALPQIQQFVCLT